MEDNKCSVYWFMILRVQSIARSSNKFCKTDYMNLRQNQLRKLPGLFLQFQKICFLRALSAQKKCLSNRDGSPTLIVPSNISLSSPRWTGCLIGIHRYPVNFSVITIPRKLGRFLSPMSYAIKHHKVYPHFFSGYKLYGPMVSQRLLETLVRCLNLMVALVPQISSSSSLAAHRAVSARRKVRLL